MWKLILCQSVRILDLIETQGKHYEPEMFFIIEGRRVCINSPLTVSIDEIFQKSFISFFNLIIIIYKHSLAYIDSASDVFYKWFFILLINEATCFTLYKSSYWELLIYLLIQKNKRKTVGRPLGVTEKIRTHIVECLVSILAFRETDITVYFLLKAFILSRIVL